MLLDIKDLSVYYGKARALNGVSLSVDQGEVVSIVGANGAGKTTILRTISALIKPASGEIWFRDKRIDKLPPHEMVKLGIAQIPAGRMIFASMSVADNLKIGAFLRNDRQKISQDLAHVYQLFPILEEKQSQNGGSLSGGQQQMLAIGRALMARPKLLLMDEPSTGLSPILVAEVGQIITDINKEGISILLVEQNCRMALKLANRAYILELGSIALSGPACDLVNNDTVKKCYLGG
jgi:branched-chain amino acid transport system ATP-binding protein